MFWRSQIAKAFKKFEKVVCDRGYPGGSVDEHLQSVKRKSRAELLRPKGMDKKSVGVAFVVTYHPHLKNINKIIKKHIKHLYADPEVRSVFTPLSFISFRSVRNLRSHLVRSKLYPQERKIVSSKCNSPRCLICKNIKECDTFTSHVTKETFKINHHFNCNSKCLIYLFSCKVCGNNMLDGLLISLGTNGTTIRTVNVKQKEEKIICKNIYMIIF